MRRSLDLLMLVLLASAATAKIATRTADSEGGMGNGVAGSDPMIAERVVAKKNPRTGEVELREEKMLLNVEDEDQPDEIDDSTSKPTDVENNLPRANPCASITCEEGLECNVSDEGQAMCVCMKQCPNDSPIKVCSSFNQTFDSECHLYQQRCLCQRNLPGCNDPKNKDMQLEYLNECRELALCTPDDMADFPRRMGDWLFQIMKELARRDELAPQYRKYEKRSEKKYQPGQPLPHPILWKFCDLDRVPNDRHISRKELMPIRAPLIPMEQCVAAFLDDCDSDNDHKLTLTEWGKCLKLQECRFHRQSCYELILRLKGIRGLPVFAHALCLECTLNNFGSIVAEIEDICSQAMQGTNKRPRSSGNEQADEDELDE